MRFKAIPKPIIKKKLYKYVIDEETGEKRKQEVSRDSDKLVLDLFDEDFQVTFNYRQN